MSLKKEFWIWIFLGIFLLLIAIPLDEVVFPYLEKNLRFPALNNISFFMTEFLIYGIFVLLLLGTAWRVWKNKNHESKLVPAAFALVFTGISGIVLKQFFAIPRPFLQIDYLYPLVHASFASFPSNHTALSFALLIPFFRISKLVGVFWGIFALLIGLARIYQNVHYPSDIAGGIFLGGFIGSLFSNPNAELLLKKWWKRVEFRRQSFHFIAGFLCVFLHWTGFLRWRIILIGLVLGLIVSAFSVQKKIPIISDILALFDRKRDIYFPGRGAFYFLLGIFLSIILFPVKIAYAAILILSVGDSLNHLFFEQGRRKRPLFWNKKKNILGLFAGIAAGTFAAQFFVPFFPALFVTTIALFLETIPFKVGKFYIDDNILIPLVSGGLLFFLLT